jgi:hypothetical protein
MRTMLTFTIPAETGNSRINDSTLPKTLESIMNDLDPEAAYFFPNNGERGGIIVFDLKDPAQIPLIAEPFFLAFNARVEFQPVMNAQDLKKALSGIDAAVRKYHIPARAA